MAIDKTAEGKAKRASKAVYLKYVEGLTQNEIAERLDVSQTSVSKYLNEEPGEEVKEDLQQQAIQTRMMTWETLTRQLQAAHERAQDAEKVTPDWDNEDNITFVTTRDAEGNIKDRFPLPDGYSVDADHEAQSDARKEIREILDAMQTVTGTPDAKIEISQPTDNDTGFQITTSEHNGDNTDNTE